MTFLVSLLFTAALGSSQADCPVPTGSASGQTSFTNADLERWSGCRYQTGALSESREAPSEPSGRARKSGSKSIRDASVSGSDAESDWRARWRSVDQKVRRLRREAKDLRREAAQELGAVPRDPKKKPKGGRRSSDLLIARAEGLEADARELENEFHDQARREGALPGWLRPKGR